MQIVNGQDDSGQNYPPDPKISLVFDDKEIHIDVEPGSNNFGRVEVGLSCTFLPGENPELFVGISVEADMGTYSISNPPQMIFSRYLTHQEFTIGFVIPPQTEKKEIVILEVELHWEYINANGSGNIGPFKKNVTIDQYSHIALGSKSIDKRIPVGEWEDVTFKVINFGNGPDQISIEVMPISDYIDVEIDKQKFLVDYEQERSFSIRLRQRSGYPGLQEIQIKAWSDIKGSQNETTLSFKFQTTHSLKSISTSPFCFMSIISMIILAVIISTWIFAYKRYFNKREEE
jgi:hypothetical protein